MFRNNKAFTLIEMLIVLLIISVLIILIIPNLTGKSDEVNSKGCDALIAVVQGQVDTFYLDHGRFPDDLDELVRKNYINADQKKCSKNRKVKYSNNGEVS